MKSETHTIILPFGHSDSALDAAVARVIGKNRQYRILKRSIDARQHRSIKVQYSITTDIRDEAKEIEARIAEKRAALDTENIQPGSVVVVGTGPAGIFAAYWLHRHGVPVTVLEQGPPMRQRIKDMARFMKQGELEPYSNICFGAGGAGTYSDGKLITRIRSPYIGYIMAQFVKYGAPESIRYLYNPHLGSNKIRHCITAMLGAMEDEGVDIRYNTRLTDIEITGSGSISKVETSKGALVEPRALFLATGHSAREVYAMLRTRGIPMEAKEFAMGVRVEHRAEFINSAQYGPHYRERYQGIETAQYKLAKTWKDENRAVYSFCMCPGGYVLNASTDTNGVVTNGMSNYLKSGKYSNAAVVVNTSQDDLNRAGYSGVDGGLAMQRELEERFRASVNADGKCNTVPAQRLTDFLGGSASKSLGGGSCLNPFAPAAMHDMFPAFMLKALRRGFEQFDRKMRGFAGDPEALVYGIESRTSAPYRILRDAERLTSPVCPQLYPAGEGAGFAGGITSAAVDGIRCAEAWLETLR